MNVTVAQRIRQLELNLERWRWLPSNLGDGHIIINIPEFRLRVIENGRPVLSMRVVVGKDFQRTCTSWTMRGRPSRSSDTHSAASSAPSICSGGADSRPLLDGIHR